MQTATCQSDAVQRTPHPALEAGEGLSGFLRQNRVRGHIHYCWAFACFEGFSITNGLRSSDFSFKLDWVFSQIHFDSRVSDTLRP